MLSSCGAAQERTLFSEKAPTVSLSSLPCPDGAELDSEIEVISCFNDDEALEDWLVKKHRDEAGVRYELCSNPAFTVPGKEVALVGKDWFLWWIPVSDATMKAVQKQMGGEIIQVSKFCSES